MKVKLPEICTIQYGYPFDSAKFCAEGGRPLIRIRDVVRGYTETYTTEQCSDEYIVKNGDMLIGMDGEFNIERWRGGEAVLNQRVCKLTPKNRVDAGYLYYYMPKALKAIEEKTPFVTVKHLSAKQLNDIDIVIPQIHEQQHIAAVLDKVSGLIALRKKQLQKLDELVKARFVEMFGDLKTNPKGWPIASFSEFAEIDGNMTTDYEKYADYPHIGIDSIEKGTGELKGYRTVREDGVISGKYIFTSKHIIYSKIRPNLNKVALPTFDGLCSADAYPILPNSKNCSRIFLAIAMRSDYFLEYILQFSSRTNLPKVNRKEISGFRMPLPPLPLQEQFAAFVDQTDKSKLAIQNGLERLEVMKKALMQKYFG